MPNKGRGMSRMLSLLSDFNSKGRIILTEKDVVDFGTRNLQNLPDLVLTIQKHKKSVLEMLLNYL